MFVPSGIFELLAILGSELFAIMGTELFAILGSLAAAILTYWVVMTLVDRYRGQSAGTARLSHPWQFSIRSLLIFCLAIALGLACYAADSVIPAFFVILVLFGIVYIVLSTGTR